MLPTVVAEIGNERLGTRTDRLRDASRRAGVYAGDDHVVDRVGREVGELQHVATATIGHRHVHRLAEPLSPTRATQEHQGCATGRGTRRCGNAAATVSAMASPSPNNSATRTVAAVTLVRSSGRPVRTSEAISNRGVPGRVPSHTERGHTAAHRRADVKSRVDLVESEAAWIAVALVLSR